MKLQSIYLLLLPVFLSLPGCSDTGYPDKRDSQVPVELRVSDEGLEAGTKVSKTITPFLTSIFATTRKGDYTAPTAPYEWKKEAAVPEDGSIVLPDTPNYPENGSWLYLVAVSPQLVSWDGSSTVSYTLDGKTDLLYAKEIQGNRWDGLRFSNNTNGKVTPLGYVHLLTKLTFKAKKEKTEGLTVTIKKITVKGVKNMAQLTLATGETSFSGTADHALILPGEGTPIQTTDVTSLEGLLLLPPVKSGEELYKLTVETSSGIFENVPVDFGASMEQPFQQGHSYVITLNIGDQELGISSVTVSPWTTIDNGSIDLIK